MDHVESKAEVVVACKFWTRSVFLLLGASLIGCKSGTNQEPLRIDNLLEQKSSVTDGALAHTKNTVSVPQVAEDYFTDSRKTRRDLADSSGWQKESPPKSGSLKNAATAVSEAFAFKPRVVPAADPTDLDYVPDTIKPSLFLSAAALHEQQGQFEAAEKQYQKLLANEPTNRAGLIGLARLKHRQGNLEKSIEIYGIAAKHHGDDPVVLNDLGLCLARAGRSAEAITYLQNAIRLNPDSLMYRNNLAAILVESNRSQEAVSTLAKSYGPAVANYNVGYLLNQHGKSQEATAYFVEALEINPSLMPARQLLEQLAPQVGTLPQQHQPPAASDAPRTSAKTPAEIPLTKPMDELLQVKAPAKLTAVAPEPTVQPQISQVTFIRQPMTQQRVALAASTSLTKKQIETKAESKAVPAAEPLIRLPAPKKSMRASLLSMPSFPQ